MQTEASCGKMRTYRRWVLCPKCGRTKVLQVLPTTVCRDLIVYCKSCKKESIVNIPSVPVP